MKLLVRVMGCGQSKSASSTVKDDHNNHDDHVEVYTKTATNRPSSTEFMVDPMTPSGEEVRTSRSPMSVSDRDVRAESASPKPAHQKQHNNSLQIPQNGNMLKRAADQPEQDRPPLKTAFKDRNFSPASLQINSNITGSQLEFFRLLDEKIELGYGDTSGEEDCT